MNENLITDRTINSKVSQSDPENGEDISQNKDYFM